MKEFNNIIGNVYGINSDEYGINYFLGNRTVDDSKHIADIKRAMLKGELISPVLIDKETRSIIDGQHRYTAATELWNEGVNYTLSIVELSCKKDKLLESAVTFNSSQKHWRAVDYINAYAKVGNKNYIALLDFCEKNKKYLDKKYKAAMSILSGLTFVNYKKGELEVTNLDLDFGQERYNIFERIADALGGTKLLFRPTIIIAVRKFLKYYFVFGCNEAITDDDSDYMLDIKTKFSNFIHTLEGSINTIPSDNSREWVKFLKNVYERSLKQTRLD